MYLIANRWFHLQVILMERVNLISMTNGEVVCILEYMFNIQLLVRLHFYFVLVLLTFAIIWLRITSFCFQYVLPFLQIDEFPVLPLLTLIQPSKFYLFHTKFAKIREAVGSRSKGNFHTKKSKGNSGK
jgi:hypothetical protein